MRLAPKARGGDHRAMSRHLSSLCALAATIACLALSPAGGAMAAEAKKASEQAVDMAPVGAPIIWHGRLVNYVFVTLRLNVRPGVDAAKVREKEPYFRDALVRLSQRVSLNLPHDLTRLDDAALKARMMAECARIVGPGQIVSVQVLSETPQRREGLPTP